MPSSAYLVKYKDPNGSRCPDAVLTFKKFMTTISPELVIAIDKKLIDSRGGHWDRVNILSVEYLGPWFDCSER